MNRIELRGVIVPSMYDSDWAQGYIEKGMITPESAFRRNLAAASKTEPLTVYVNSPGGSVFSAYEMINALQTWKAESKQPVNVVIGAMAASAASALSIMAGTTIKAHKNSKMMFHGAQTMTEGGKDAHGDQADLLGKINADIMNALISRYNMNPDTVAGWFAEGRAGWLTAQEMQASGIISGIEDADDNVIELDDGALAEMNGQGLDIAAYMDKETQQDETENGDGSAAVEETETAKESGTEDGTANDQDATKAQRDADLVAAKIAIAVSEKTVELSTQVEDLRAAYTKLDTEKRGVQSRLDKVTADFETAKKTHTAAILNMQDALEKANARIVRFLGAANSFSPEPKDWAEALKLCNGSHEQAKARFDHLRQAYKQEQVMKRETKR